MKGALIPDGGNARLSFFHEGKPEESAALHAIAEGFAVVGGLGHFLEFADGFINQAHLAEGGPEIVVSFEVFVFNTHFAELGTKFVKDFLERAVLSRAGALFFRLRRTG